jgi:hypothetical protein
MVLLALACAAVLISTAVLAVVVADDARARQVVYHERLPELANDLVRRVYPPRLRSASTGQLPQV